MMSHDHQLPAEVRKCLNELTQRLQTELGKALHEVCLFGSYARGEATLASDVDVLVVVEQAPLHLRDQISDIAADVGLDHDLVISTVVWDVTHRQQHELLQTLLIRNIQSEGVVLWMHP